MSHSAFQTALPAVLSLGGPYNNGLGANGMIAVAGQHHRSPVSVQTTTCYEGVGSACHGSIEHISHMLQLRNGAGAGHTASPFCSATSEVVRAFGKTSQAAHSAQTGATHHCPISHHAQHAANNISSFKRCSESDPLRADSCHDGDSFSHVVSSLLGASIGSFSTPQTCILSSHQSCPAHGIKAVCGKRSKMEDMFQVQANFFDLPVSSGTCDDAHNKLPARFAAQQPVNGPTDVAAAAAGCGPQGGGVAGAAHFVPPPGSSLPMSPSNGGRLGSEHEASIGGGSSGSDASTNDTLHFFGVYDGHGGTEASAHCAKRLHHHLGEALASICCALASDVVECFDNHNGQICQAEWSLGKPAPRKQLAAGAAAAAGGSSITVPPAAEASSRPCHMPADDTDLLNGVSNADMLLMSGTSDDNDSSDSGSEAGGQTGSLGGSFRSSAEGGPASASARLEEALRDAFVRTDAEFATDGSANMVGSTAVVALVGTKKLWIANCGDSRAVLCRAAKAIQLTDDHKPEREDEAERVERAGGQVLYFNGHRVMGVLAMSRAIGDHALRPYVICEPEITVMTRTEDDDFLLLASDGLWDVMTNQEATNLAIRCLRRAREKGASKKAAVRIAASVLTKAAMDRGSKDNITVVIVDLSGPSRPSAASAVAAGVTAGADEDVLDESCTAAALKPSACGAMV